MISQYFGDLPEKKKIEFPVVECELPDEKESFAALETQQNHVVIGCEGRSINDPQRYAASMMSLIL